MTVVQMHFGDGTHHEIEVTSSDPEEAVEQARDYVKDNAWFTVMDETGLNVLAEERLS